MTLYHFSTSSTAHGYAISLFPGFFKPTCLFKTHLFISWAYDPLFLPHGPNGFAICLPIFTTLVVGLFFFLLGFSRITLNTDDKCNLCKERETSGHILWSCETTREAWDVLNIKVTNLNAPIEEFIDVVLLLWEDEGDKDWEMIATNAWSLWNNRNAVRHSGQCKQGKVIATEVQKYVEEFRATIPYQFPKGHTAPLRGGHLHRMVGIKLTWTVLCLEIKERLVWE